MTTDETQNPEDSVQPSTEAENVAPAENQPEESIPAGETAEVIEAPATEPVAEAATESSAPATEEPKPEEADTGSRPRVSLNPTVSEGSFKAKPSYKGGNPAESSAENKTDQLSTKAVAAQEIDIQAARVESVEVPPEVGDLEVELESEIAAALSDGLDFQAPVVVPDSEDPEDAEPPAEDELEEGTRLKGTVQSISGDDVFMELGYRSPGLISIRQFDPKKPPVVGQEFNLMIDRMNLAEGLIHVNLPTGRRKPGGDLSSMAKGQIVDCMVKKTNKGGLEVEIGSLRGFMPASQVEYSFVEDLEQYVGQKLSAMVTEVNPQKRNLVLSRRALLLEERKDAEATFWETIEEGQTITGKVKTMKDYGAFVDLGGTDGFLHIGEISWSRLKHPSEVLAEGQEVEVAIIKLDKSANRISLSMKSLGGDPWLDLMENFPIGSTTSGKVTRLMEFGAFVELQPGVEGLIHISEMAHRRVSKVSTVVQEGQEVDVKVLQIDPDKKRISLSLKALVDRPVSEKDAAPVADEDLAPSAGESFVSKRKGPLKGGNSGGASAGGGLFGNPGDFK
jgi:small subunit ribosomal protein S1